MMRNLRTYSFSLFLVISAFPVFADDALISELIRLDESRRAEVETLHIEYDLAEHSPSESSYELLGNVWEQNGEDTFRFRNHIKDFPYDYKSGDNVRDMIVDVAIDSSKKYELRVPYEAFPPDEPLILCEHSDYNKQGYFGRITYNPGNLWEQMLHPFFILPIPGVNVRTTYRELFEKSVPKRVEKIESEVGDVLVQVEFSGEETDDDLMTNRWSTTIDFNLSKGGLVSKYFFTNIRDGSDLPVHCEGIVNRFEESHPGHWYPQKMQQLAYTNDSAQARVTTITINKFVVNKKSEEDLDPVQFPAGLVVYETDTKTNQTVYHIWGKNKSEKKFADRVKFLEYVDERCFFAGDTLREPPKSASPIRSVLLVLGAFLGVFLIVSGLYERQCNKNE